MDGRFILLLKNDAMIESKSKAGIISIGDEILIGQIVNTNAAWMGQQLNDAGYSVAQIVVISDTEEAIHQALDDMIKKVSFILITGGLGPTKDDVTKKSLANYFNTSLVMNQEALDNVKSFFASRNMTLTETNHHQGLVPDNSRVFINRLGTAPIMWFEKEGVTIVSMPGVPAEMKAAMTNQIIPALKEKYPAEVIIHKTIMTHGMGESHLAEVIESWELNLPSHMSLAWLPRPGIVRLRLSAVGKNRTRLAEEVEEQVSQLLALIPDLVFGFDNVSMEEVVAALLTARNKTVATAESCTGGAIASRLTSLPGSSAYFKGSVVAYANDVKNQVLQVDMTLLETEGAVSESVARQMASHVRKIMKTDFGVAVTGIAGPSGGSPEKPVGTVWIAVAKEKNVVSRKFLFGTVRERNIERTILSALNMLRLELIEAIW